MTDPPTAVPPDVYEYRQRLVVYVVWHPSFEQGEKFAERLYDHLSRDSQQPIARGLGIPVYFRSAPADDHSEVPEPIWLEEAHHTAVVVLVDDNMVLSAPGGWSDYLVELRDRISEQEGTHLLLPVMLSKRAFGVAPGIDQSNFIRPPNNVEPAAWASALLSGKDKHFTLLNPIVHELCRLLLNVDRIKHDAAGFGERIAKRVKVFISHAKKDGAEIAEAIRDHINQKSQLKTFFDANDIPFGSEFARVLEKSVEGEYVAVLVVHTDAYSSREWCQREILLAKKNELPVLILDALKVGEKCSFPYMGNTPTLRIAPEGDPDMELVLGHLLIEVLRTIHFLQHFLDLRDLARLTGEVKALPQTPELVTVLELKDAGVPTIVYQDPPLGAHLLEDLSRFAPELTLTTPVLLLTSGLRAPDQPRPLAGRIVGLSVSESPDLGRLGFQKAHVEDATVEFARYLIQAGGILAYGGDLRPGGFTEILRDLTWTYEASDDRSARLLGYLHWAIHQGRLGHSPEFLEWTDPKGFNRTQFRFVNPPIDQVNSKPQPPSDRSPGNLLIHARCLAAMRERMAGETDARVMLGGKLTGYMGRVPGLADEALLSIRLGKPVYLLGGFGGGAGAVAEAVQGLNPAALTWDFQKNDPAYVAMVAEYDKIAGVEKVDYPAMVAELKGIGVAGLSAVNGLTVEENLRLFETPHVIEMVYLVLRGLLNAPSLKRP